MGPDRRGVVDIVNVREGDDPVAFLHAARAVQRQRYLDDTEPLPLVRPPRWSRGALTAAAAVAAAAVSAGAAATLVTVLHSPAAPGGAPTPLSVPAATSITTTPTSITTTPTIDLPAPDTPASDTPASDPPLQPPPAGPDTPAGHGKHC